MTNKKTPALFWTDCLKTDTLTHAAFSNPIKKKESSPTIHIRAIEAKKRRLYQVTVRRGSQAFHKNLSPDECLEAILQEWMPNYKQCHVKTANTNYQLLINKGKTRILYCDQHQSSKEICSMHNRHKHHILEVGKPALFLVKLGIMNNEGKVYPKMMAKFRQINRFLELAKDTIPFEATTSVFTIIDFGCGKGYLTFALYHYLVEKLGWSIRMIGIDLKETVISNLTHLAKELQYDNLQFVLGNVESFETGDNVDMVIALHACDTATDAALAKAVHWNAKTILAVPCCQQELLPQVACQDLEGLFNFPILKERFCSLLTDALRAQWLEAHGYRTQIVEFIDTEHTPKNLLIRATRDNTPKRRDTAAIIHKHLKQMFHVKQRLLF